MLQKRAIPFCCSLLAISLQVCVANEQLPMTLQATPASVAVPSSPPIMASSHENSSPTQFVPFTGSISGSKVRMRTHPSLDSHVVRETLRGDMFAVVGETSEYYAILPPKGTKGYVFRTFILDGKVEGERVNVRLSADTEAPVVAQLNRGDVVEAVVSGHNNKWLEIDLPETSRFYIAKEYVEKVGGIELVTAFEKKKVEASHLLSSASLFAQAEIQKPFEQIDFDRIRGSFEKIVKDYQDMPAVVEQAMSTTSLMQDLYIQKKIAFLENKSGLHDTVFDAEYMEKLAKLGIPIAEKTENDQVVEVASAAADTMGLSSTLGGEEITDKMLAWQPLEESIYHLWAASHSEKSIEEFYSEEEQSATTLSGIIEPYNRPVKNRPGDFLLKNDNLPVAFLYSTKVNLEKLIGKKVSLIAAPRPNHHFAFPAYFVLEIE